MSLFFSFYSNAFNNLISHLEHRIVISKEKAGNKLQMQIAGKLSLFFPLKAWNVLCSATWHCLNMLLAAWSGISETETMLAIILSERTGILLFSE